MIPEDKILDHITKLRIEKGLSRNRLAKEAGLSPSTLKNMYVRNTLPTIPTLYKICEGMDITPSDFFADQYKLELTESQKELVNLYIQLSPRDKVLATAFIRNLLNHPEE